MSKPMVITIFAGDTVNTLDDALKCLNSVRQVFENRRELGTQLPACVDRTIMLAFDSELLQKKTSSFVERHSVPKTSGPRRDVKSRKPRNFTTKETNKKWRTHFDWDVATAYNEKNRTILNQKEAIELLEQRQHRHIDWFKEIHCSSKTVMVLSNSLQHTSTPKNILTLVTIFSTILSRLNKKDENGARKRAWAKISKHVQIEYRNNNFRGCTLTHMHNINVNKAYTIAKYNLPKRKKTMRTSHKQRRERDRKKRRAL